MAQQNKREIVKITSPRGTFKWPKLVDPDYGTKQFPKNDGEYSVTLVMKRDDPATQKFVNKLQTLADEAREKGMAEFKALKVQTRKSLEAKGAPHENPFFKVEYDRETEEETGNIEFKFTMKASGERKKGPKAGSRWNRKPVLFDAKGTRMDKAPDIWGGTIGKVSFTVEKGGYFIPGQGMFGIKLQLEAAQIIDLVSGGQRTADDYGFEEEEDGYSHEEPTATDDDGGFGDETGGDGEDDAEADF